MNADVLKRNQTHPANSSKHKNHLQVPQRKMISDYSNVHSRSNKSVIYLLSLKNNDKDEEIDPIINLSPRRKKMGTVMETIPISIIKKRSLTKKRVTIAGAPPDPGMFKDQSLNRKRRTLDVADNNLGVSNGTKSSFHSMSKFHKSTKTREPKRKSKENDFEINLANGLRNDNSEEYDEYENSIDQDNKKDNSQQSEKELKRYYSPKTMHTKSNDDNHSVDTDKRTELKRKNQLDLNYFASSYNFRINQLQKEIHNEKEKWRMKTDSYLNEVIDHLNHQLLDKDIIIEKLNKLNIQQMKKLTDLSKDADNVLKKVRYHPIALKSRNLIQPIHELTIQDSVKLKEKQLKNTFSLATILTKENDFLKSKYYRLGDRKSLLTLGNQSKEHKANVATLQSRIKKLKQSLEEHLKCEKIHDDYFQVIQSMKEDVKMVQLSNMNLTEKIKEIEQRYSKALAYSQKKKHTKTFSVISNIPLKRSRNILITSHFNHFSTINLTSTMQVNTSLNNNNQSINNPNTSTINGNFSTINVSTTYNNSLEGNEKKTMESRLEMILTQKEIEVMKSFFNEKKTEYDNAVRRIIILENMRQSSISQHKAEVKRNQSKIKELEEDLKYLLSKQKDLNVKRKLYEAQIKVCTNELKSTKRKLGVLKEELMAINPNLIIRDATIKSLQSELVLRKTKYINE